MIDESKYYVFYDGECGFCNYWVQWILKNDTKDQFRFASLQSGFGQNFLKERGLEMVDFDTIILWKPLSFYLTKSEAIFRIMKMMGGTYKLLSYASLLPSFISNFVYSIIASKRKSFKVETCAIPTAEERKKFMD